MVCVDDICSGVLNCLLVAVGSVPSVVYLTTVPAGEPSGTDMESDNGVEATRPAWENTGAPRMSLYTFPQFLAPGVGLAWYPQLVDASVVRPYAMLGAGCFFRKKNI